MSGQSQLDQEAAFKQVSNDRSQPRIPIPQYLDLQVARKHTPQPGETCGYNPEAVPDRELQQSSHTRRIGNTTPARPRLRQARSEGLTPTIPAACW
jgi:hypothetical protein